MDGIKSSSLADLIDLVASIIRAAPQRLTEIDLRDIGGSREQGELILDALLHTQLQLKDLDISEN